MWFAGLNLSYLKLLIDKKKKNRFIIVLVLPEYQCHTISD